MISTKTTAKSTHPTMAHPRLLLFPPLAGVRSRSRSYVVMRPVYMERGAADNARTPRSLTPPAPHGSLPSVAFRGDCSIFRPLGPENHENVSHHRATRRLVAAHRRHPPAGQGYGARFDVRRRGQRLSDEARR